MDGVPQLEGEHCISFPLLELGSQLVRGKSVLVQTILPPDSLQNFQITTKTPVTRFPDKLWRGYVSYEFLNIVLKLSLKVQI